MTILGAVLTSAASIVVVLSWLYLVERTKHIAREASDSALANQKLQNDKLLEDYKHEREQVLEALRSSERRRVTEFDLYTRERHRAYARVFRKFKVASDRLSNMRGVVRLPDFSQFGVPEVLSYMQSNSIGATFADPVVEAYKQGDKNAPRMLRDLELRRLLSEAVDAARRAKNVEVLEDLYLSDAVRAQMTVVRKAVGAFQLALEYKPDPLTDEKQAAMERSVELLYTIMRSELSSGNVS